MDPNDELYWQLQPYFKPFDTMKRSSYVVVNFGYTFLEYISHKKFYEYSGYKDEEIDKLISVVNTKGAKRLFEVLKSCGGLYIKMGQGIASMVDLIPDEYVNTMIPMFDEVPTVPFDEIKRIFKVDFGKDVHELFKEFDTNSIASASLAQVHKAVTKDGVEVAVKVQYPQVRYFRDADLFTQKLIMKIFAFFSNRKYRKEFDKIQADLAKEIDFIQEANNMKRAKENFQKINLDSVYIPYVLDDLTTKRVLTMEFIHGIKGKDVTKLKKEGFNLKTIATDLFTLISEQIFTFGFLHADIHGGNFFVRRNPKSGREQIVLIDHGLYGEISDEFRIDFCKLWVSIINRDHQSLQQHCDKYGIKNPALYSQIIIMQGLDSFGPTIQDDDNAGMKLSIEDRRKFFNPNKQEREDMKNLEEVLPIEIMFILRTLFLLRNVNKNLGAPVNRFTIMSRIASKNFNKNEKVSWYQNFYFELKLRLIEWVTFIVELFYGFYKSLY